MVYIIHGSHLTHKRLILCTEDGDFMVCMHVEEEVLQPTDFRVGKLSCWLQTKEEMVLVRRRQGPDFVAFRKETMRILDMFGERPELSVGTSKKLLEPLSSMSR